MSNFKIKRVELRDFKRHESLDVEFADGVTAIRGPNYVGKSTILEAVFYALIGLSAVPGGKKTATRRGSKGCSVSLYFECAEGEGVIVRTLTTASVTVAGKLKATGQTSVNAWVEDFFGMGQKLMQTLAFSPQSETSVLVTLGAAELNRIIEAVSNSKYVDELADKAAKVASIAEAKLQDIGEIQDQATLVASLADAEAGLERETEVATSCVAATTKARGTLEFLKEDKAKLVEHNKTAKKLAAKAKDLEYSVQSCSEQVLKLGTEIGEMEAARVNTDGLAEVKKAAEADIRALEEAKITKVRLTSRISQLQKDVADLAGDEAKAENVAKLATARALLDKLTAAGTKAYAEVKGLTKELQTAKSDLDGSVCSACQRPFDASHLAEAEAKVEKLTKELADASVACSAAEKAYVAARDAHNKLQGLQPRENWETRLASARQELKDSSSLLQDFKSDEEVSDKLKALKAELLSAVVKEQEAESQDRAIRKKKATLAECCETLSSAREALKTLNVPEEMDPAPLDESLELANSAFVEASTQEVRQAGVVTEYKGKVAKLEAEAKANAAKLEKRKDLETRAARFGAFAGWLRKNKAAFLAETWAGILASTSEFASECTGGAVTQVLRDDSGDFSYVENGEVYPAEAASGGQKSIIGVGLRLALAALLPQGCRLVALDEPSGDLNDEHATMLTSALRGQGRQVIMTTHREGDEVIADEVVTLN